MYHQFNIQQFYVLPHTVYLCVLCGSQNKQPLFPSTTLTRALDKTFGVLFRVFIVTATSKLISYLTEKLCASIRKISR